MTSLLVSNEAIVRRTLSALEALDSPFRLLLLAHVAAAGPVGLRPSTLAERTGRSPDLVAKHLRVLADRALVANTIHKEDGRIASYYIATVDGLAWLDRVGLREVHDLIPVLERIENPDRPAPADLPSEGEVVRSAKPVRGVVAPTP